MREFREEKTLTWQFLQRIQDFSPSRLHRYAIFAHHKSKHHEADELARVGLCIEQTTVPALGRVFS